jgi:hypothetical protein
MTISFKIYSSAIVRMITQWDKGGLGIGSPRDDKCT